MVAAVQSKSIQEPIPFFRHPLQWIAKQVNIVSQKIFGYLLRLSVFQLGEYKRPLGYLLIRAYQRVGSDPRDEKPVSRERLERSKSLLLLFGGVESVVIPQDGKAEIRLMTFTSAEFFRRIDQLGGQRMPIILKDAEGKEEQRFAIFPKPETSPEEFQDLCNKMQKFYLPCEDLPTDQGMQKGILLPAPLRQAPGQTPPMVVRFHSPGRSMVMDRKFIGLHLGAGYDICITDPRGTIDSSGTPSEGGYYLDADAVYQYILKQSYTPDRIWLSGYCEGAAVAAYLKKKYHAQGVHFIAENPFNSLLDTVKSHNVLGRKFAHRALPEIHAKDPATARLVEQDGFDNEAKFLNLPHSSGKFFLIHTDNDKTMPPDSIPRIRQAIGNAGPYFELMRHHPDPEANGHMQPPIEDPAVWRRYVEVVI
jgi:hypothetical protein